jgi:hypothetical protein
MQFIFDSYTFDHETGEAVFSYDFSDGRHFVERAYFNVDHDYDASILDKALFLAFVLIGTSYYKTFPTRDVVFTSATIDQWQADFFNDVYQEGLSQFAFENGLTRNELAHFEATSDESQAARHYTGSGMLALQSGGKDSLLVATLLRKANKKFTPWYVASSNNYPEVLDTFSQPLVITKRLLDHENLQLAQVEGGKNGHVPVTYILEILALIQAILLGNESVVVSIAHEGEEPHEWVGDLPVNHQWSKTWAAEQSLASYVEKYVAKGLRIGSPLRQYSELKMAELFVEHAWGEYGYSFSSCNLINYKQGQANGTLKWCGKCPKCANSYLLFAPFVDSSELQTLFDGQDLFTEPSLEDTFKGLLGIDGVMKPFECIGEIDELRMAYHKAQARGGYHSLLFDVPESQFDYERLYSAQGWATEMLQ